MKISFQLASAIDRCVRFTKSGGFSPEFNYLCFKGDTIRAFNGFSGIVHLSDQDFGDKAVIIPGDKMSKLLHSLGSDLEIIPKDGNILTIKSSGRFISKLNVIGDTNDSMWTVDIPVEEIQPIPEDFFSSIRQIYFSVSKDETKGSMKGIYSNGTSLYSTDNFRMSRFPFVLGVKDLVVPDVLLELVINEPNPTGYSIKDGKLWLTFEDFLVYTNVFSSKFPDCVSVFNSFHPSPEDGVKFNLEELAKVLERFEFLASSYPNRVDVGVFPPNLILTTQGPGVSEAIEVVNCESKLKSECAFSVNVKFFKEIVGKSNQFFINDRFLLFKSETGLESILLLLESGEENLAKSILGRAGKDLSFRGEEEIKGSSE